MPNDTSGSSPNHRANTRETCRRWWSSSYQYAGARPVCTGIVERDEKLRAHKKHQNDAYIARFTGNFVSVPVAYTATMENAIAQSERDLKELARK